MQSGQQGKELLLATAEPLHFGEMHDRAHPREPFSLQGQWSFLCSATRSSSRLRLLQPAGLMKSSKRWSERPRGSTSPSIRTLKSPKPASAPLGARMNGRLQSHDAACNEIASPRLRSRIFLCADQTEPCRKSSTGPPACHEPVRIGATITRTRSRTNGSLR